MILPVFTKLIETPEFVDSKRPRVIAMLVLRKLMLHVEDAQYLDLETSRVGQWCLKALQSSVRELRIAAR